ncbi:threonine/serine dehydratase [Pseudarthrobacter sp. AG30]|uniref:threonine ammonia-lyase n=1 Tax=Pseudarthrobacter sp. AG30 TaxID=2249742 RepID=UPI0014027942|nr:pyridoxal-phosphate dependent enzyme [Pseudarthrobacter sp. AG30]
MSYPTHPEWERRLPEALSLVRGHLPTTPLVPISLDGFDAPAYLKLETLQPTGSFKVRGALAAVAAAKRSGLPVVSASAGNHGLGIAFAAERLGTTAVVVVPENASTAKVNALRRYDVDLRLIGNSYDAAEEAAVRIAEETGGRFVSGYSDPDVIAGQASVVAEVLSQLDGEFQIVVPVGGGGLAAGIALGAPKRASVIGVESEHSHAVSVAMAAGRNIQVDIGATITDGTAGNIAHDAFTPQILREHAVAMVRAEEQAVRSCVRDLALHYGVVGEGAAVMGIAAAVSGSIPANQPTVFVITGRNIATERFMGLVGS